MRRALLVIALGACGGGGMGEPANPRDEAKARKVECEKMADHLVTLMSPGLPNLPPDDPEVVMADKISRVLIGHCYDDQWSVEARDCFSTVPTLEGAEKCAPFLTVPQRDAMNQAMDEALGPKAPK